MRHYKSGSTWALWRWTFVPTGYITRLHLVKTPWFAICLHWLNGPDPEPYLHDHPVDFLSIVLRGGYTESLDSGLSIVYPGAVTLSHRVRLFNLVSCETKHRITQVEPNTLTLTFMGPKMQDWGFYLPSGRVSWQEYNRRYK
jgi:hypothetical protein